MTSSTFISFIYYDQVSSIIKTNGSNMLCINQLYMLIQLEKGQILSGCKQHEKGLLEDVTGCKSYEEDVISYHIIFFKNV